MPICPSCRYGYDEGLSFCPRCGANGHHPHKCGPFAMLCLRMAQLASFVSVIISLVSSVIAIMNGAFAMGLVTLLIATPISIGSFVSFGLVIRYAKGE